MQKRRRNPIVKGGQGRTPDDMVDGAWIVSVCIIIFFVVTIIRYIF